MICVEIKLERNSYNRCVDLDVAESLLEYIDNIFSCCRYMDFYTLLYCRLLRFLYH